MYPRLVVDIGKLKNNLDAVGKITKDEGHMTLTVVTKALCADKEVMKMIATHEMVDYMADSRIQNIQSYCDYAHKHGKKTLLLRIPMECEIEEVVRYADISFNSEISTLKLLNEEAGMQEKRHRIVLMIDLGDLREGIFFENEDEIFRTVEEILKLENLVLEGIGVNLTCYGAIIPKYDNLHILADIAEKIEEKFNIFLKMVSGGNSSSIYLLEEHNMPEGINNLRLGEAFILGNDTAYGHRLPGTVDDALLCQAQIVELKEKPSVPIGEIGTDAFGHVPHYEDKGIMKRAILGIGMQDTDIESMIPIEDGIEILGASSDHMLVDVTHAQRELKVGDVISFKLGYGAAMKNATSPYVYKRYL